MSVSCCLLAFSLTTRADEAPTYPSTTLSNAAIKVLIYLPDARAGYSRGPRFDWSGMVGRVEAGGHRFFRPFRTPHRPEDFESADGVPDEFGIEGCPGFDEAKVGEPFLKIGVGALRRLPPELGKPDAYNFFRPYPILDPGTWSVHHTERTADFEQRLTVNDRFAIVYQKQIELIDDPRGPGFVVKHQLQNVGKATIDTDVYCHNFISIDDQPVGPGYAVTFGLDVVPKDPGPFAGVTALSGRTMTFLQPLPSHSLWAELASVQHLAEENQVTVSHSGVGAAVIVQGDTAVEKVRFYAENHVICPELFVTIHVPPGETQSWSNRYVFANLKK